MKFESTWAVGDYRCTMSWDGDEGGLITSSWDPRVPRGLSKREQAQYRAGRDELFKKISAHLNMSVLVVET